MQNHSSMVVVIVLALLLAAGQSSAQQVRGAVRDSGSGLAVAGGVVSLVDATGRATVRGIADAQGRFRLPYEAGAVTLQVLRIGFRPANVQLPVANTTGDIELAVRMVRLPTLLEAVHVADQPLCSTRRDRPDALALWEQARAGLLATVVARDANPAQVWELRYQRDLDQRGARIVRQRVRGDSALSSRPFVAAASPEEFASRGYIREITAGDTVNREYQAPDADVLLDESFAATHCFRLEPESSDHGGQIGLAFEPMPSKNGRDTLVDVAGILWIDRSPPALREMTYRYTALEPAAVAAGAGGYLHFLSMQNGIVLIDRWHIRMPVFAQPEGVMPGTPFVFRRRRLMNTAARVSHLQDEGGVVTTAVWPPPNGLRWDAPLGRVEGRVVERGGTQPVPNVHVWLEGAEVETFTDSAGRFVFEKLLSGPYTVHAADPTLAMLGAEPTDAEVEVRDSATTQVTVLLEPRGAALAHVCGGHLSKDGGILLVHLTAESGVPPISKARLRAQWSVGNVPHDGAGPPGSDGAFRVCDVPLGNPVRLLLTFGTIVAQDTVVIVPRFPRVTRIDLAVNLK